MKPSLEERIEHIRQAIEDLRDLLSEKTVIEFIVERHTRAATERYLEIISEASRHIPDRMKQSRPEVPWKDIAGIGNVLRHDYHKITSERIWDVYKDDLDLLSVAVEAILADAGSDR